MHKLNTFGGEADEKNDEKKDDDVDDSAGCGAGSDVGSGSAHDVSSASRDPVTKEKSSDRRDNSTT